jgi:hypothetical protein
MPGAEGSATSRAAPLVRVRRLAYRLASLLVSSSSAMPCMGARYFSSPQGHLMASPLASVAQTLTNDKRLSRVTLTRCPLSPLARALPSPPPLSLHSRAYKRALSPLNFVCVTTTYCLQVSRHHAPLCCFCHGRRGAPPPLSLHHPLCAGPGALSCPRSYSTTR